MESHPIAEPPRSTPPSAEILPILSNPQVDAPRAHRKWKVLALMLLLCVTLTLLAGAQTSPWKLDLRWDNDTVRYYDTQNFVVRRPSQIFFVLMDPFFRAPDSGSIEAPAGKPVFVALLRLWGMGTRILFGHNAWLTRSAYFKFQLFAYGLLALSICALGWRLGSPCLGMLAAVISLLNPWAMIQLVYRNYTCLGMAILVAACLLALRRAGWATLLAGVLAWMAFLTDNAILLYSIMLGGVVLALHLGRWRQMFRHGLLYALGLVLPYVLLAGVGMIWYRHHAWPLRVTIEYYTHFAKDNHFATRPGAEARPTVPKYPGIALLFISKNSIVIFSLILVVAAVTYWKLARIGVRAALDHPALLPILGLFVPVFACWALIDIKPGAQLAHSYFVGYPFVVLGLTLFWWRLTRNLRLAWGLLALGYVVETAVGLHQYRAVFFSLQNRVAAVMSNDKHQKIAMLYNDPHSRIIQHLLSPEYADRIVIVRSLSDIAQLASDANAKVSVYTQAGPGLLRLDSIGVESGDYIGCVLFGREGETMVYCPPVPTWIEDPFHGRRNIPANALTLHDAGGHDVVTFSEPADVPFYGLYPLLIFDDEWPTWKFITRLIDDQSCMTGPGAIRLSRVTYAPHRAPTSAR